MKKLLIGAAVAAIAALQVVHAAEPFAERQALLQKLHEKGAKTIEIAFNPGSTQKNELFYWANKYWPLANEITAATQDIISLIPEENNDVLVNLIKLQRYKWIAAQPSIAVIAQEHGYTPLMYLNKEFESVFVVPVDGALNKTADLKGKKIATLDKSNDSRFAKYYLNSEGLDGVYVDVGSSGYPDVLAQLKNKKVDAVAVRREVAESFIASNKDKESGKEKFKILASAGTTPMLVVLAHVSVSDKEVNKITSALQNVNNRTMATVGFKFNDNEAAFLPFTKDHLKYMRAALGFVEPDYGRFIYDPKTDKYLESHQLFTVGTVKPELKQPNP